MKTHRYRLHFNAKAEAELLAEAIHMLENAKETHDMLEAFYIPAMDFKKVEKRGAQITQALLGTRKAHGEIDKFVKLFCRLFFHSLHFVTRMLHMIF